MSKIYFNTNLITVPKPSQTITVQLQLTNAKIKKNLKEDCLDAIYKHE